MKRKVFSILFALVLVLSFSLVTAVPVGATPDATITIEDIEVMPGETITVPVMALDVDSSDNVCQAGFDLQFDPSVVTVTNVTKGDIPAGMFIFDWEVFANDVATYQMDFSYTYSGEITLAYVTFQAVGDPGDSCQLQFGDCGNRFLGTFLANFGGVDVSPLTFDDGTFTILSPTIEVDIDIKPGSDPNSINPNSKGLIAVAILGSDIFDVTTVDVTTLDFEGASPAHDLTDSIVYTEHLQNVNGDGYTDLVSHYRTQDTGIAKGDTDATLTGQTTGGTPITGTDSIMTVGKP